MKRKIRKFIRKFISSKPITLKKLINGRVCGYQEINIIGYGDSDKERILFSGTRTELSEIYFDNKWYKEQVVGLYGKWANEKGLYIMIPVIVGDTNE